MTWKPIAALGWPCMPQRRDWAAFASLWDRMGKILRHRADCSHLRRLGKVSYLSNCVLRTLQKQERVWVRLEDVKAWMRIQI